MMENDRIFHDLLEEQAKKLVDSVNQGVPDHRFSLRYKLKKRALLKAYELSQRTAEKFEISYKRAKLSQTIALALLSAFTAMLMTGAAMYAVRLINGLKAKEYVDHSDIFAVDENAPEYIERRYRISYDLSDWKKTVLIDDNLTYWEKYERGVDTIKFSYYPKNVYQNFRHNTEYTGIETVIINGKETIYYSNQTDVQSLVWDGGDYIFQLDFTITFEEAETIIESITEYD